MFWRIDHAEGLNNNYLDQTYRTTTNGVFEEVGKETAVRKYLVGSEVGTNTMGSNTEELGIVTALIIT